MPFSNPHTHSCQNTRSPNTAPSGGGKSNDREEDADRGSQGVCTYLVVSEHPGFPFVPRKDVCTRSLTDRLPPPPPPPCIQHTHQALHTRNLKAGLDVSDPSLKEAWRSLVADDAAGAAVGWVLFGYDGAGANTGKCVVAATGSGASGLLDALREDQVGVLAGIRPICPGKHQRSKRRAPTAARRPTPHSPTHHHITTPTHHEYQIFFGALRAREEASSDPRPRLLSFLWVGPRVGPLKRGKAALHRNAVQDGAMEGGSMLRGEVALWDEERGAVVTEEELRARVRRALGLGSDAAVAVAVAS